MDPVSAIPIDVTPGAEIRNADIRIRRGPTVHVRGKIPVAVPGMNIYLQPASGEYTATAKDGTFDIADVSPGTYRITAFSPPFRNATPRIFYGRSTITVDDNGLDDLTLEVRPAIDVTGRFVVEGQSADPQNITPLWPSPPALRLPSSAVTIAPTAEIAADGSFRIPNVLQIEQPVFITPPPGMYVKSMRFGDQDISARQAFDASAGEGSLDITLARNAGEVVTQAYDAGGMPVAGVSALLWSKDAERSAVGTLGADNLQHFTNLAPGDYLLVAWEQADPPLSEADVKALFESRATKVTVTEGAVAAIGVKLITSDEIDQALAKAN